MKKKILQNLLLAIAIAMAGISAMQTASAQAVTSIDIGLVSAGGSGSGGSFTYSSSVVTLTTTGGNYVITGGTANKRIVVQSGITANITLNGVNISVEYCPFDMSGATVNLTLTGENTLKSGYNRAGINVPNGASLTIDGGGTLNATGGSQGAGIGGGNNGTAGSLEINGGSVKRSGSGPESPALNAGVPVYLVTLTVVSPAVSGNTAITAGTIGGITCDATNTPPTTGYGIKDVYTDAAGKVYFWLPVETVNGTRDISLTAGGVAYSNTAVPAADNDGNAATLYAPAAPTITTVSLPNGKVGELRLRLRRQAIPPLLHGA
jgi:hypothetical protein